MKKWEEILYGDKYEDATKYPISLSRVKQNNLERILISKSWCKDGVSPASRVNLTKVWERYLLLFENVFIMVKKEEIGGYLSNLDFGNFLGLYDLLTGKELEISDFIDKVEIKKLNAYKICKKEDCLKVFNETLTEIIKEDIYMILLRGVNGKIDAVTYSSDIEDVEFLIGEEIEAGRRDNAEPLLYNLETGEYIDWDYSFVVNIYI